MLVIAVVMLAIVVLAALVVTYVAFPHRGEAVPAAPWLGDAMARAAEAAPTLPTEGDAGQDPLIQPTSDPMAEGATDPASRARDTGRKH